MAHGTAPQVQTQAFMLKSLLSRHPPASEGEKTLPLGSQLNLSIIHSVYERGGTASRCLAVDAQQGAGGRLGSDSVTRTRKVIPAFWVQRTWLALTLTHPGCQHLQFTS